MDAAAWGTEKLKGGGSLYMPRANAFFGSRPFSSRIMFAT